VKDCLHATDLVLAIDVGTGSTKMVVYDLSGNQVCSTDQPYRTYEPVPGWSEQSADDWWRAVVCGCRVLWDKGVEPAAITGIGLSGQMENCLPLDGSGRPLRPAILYSDSRAIREAAAVVRQMGQDSIRDFSGNWFDQATTAAKLLWLKEHEPEVYKSTRVVVSGAKDYVAYRLTGYHATDPTNGSTTGLMNIHTRNWDDSFIAALGLSPSLLPPILSASQRVGCVSKEAAEETGLSAGCPVFCGAGDAGTANVGAGVIAPDRAHCYLGTTGWVATVSKVLPPGESEGLFTLCDLNPEFYILVAPLLNAGRAYRWVIDALGESEKRVANETGTDVYLLMEETMARTLPGCNGLVFLPYLVGERSPFKDPNACGVFFGLSDKTTRHEMIRATLEGVCFGIRQAMNAVPSQTKVEKLTVIGGGSRSRVWTQILADTCACSVVVPEGGASGPCLGAAMTVLVGLGIAQDYSEVDGFIRIERVHEPVVESEERYNAVFSIYESLYPALKPVFKRRRELMG